MDRLITVLALTAIGLVSKWQLSRRSSKPALPEPALPDDAGLPVTDRNWQWPVYDQYRGKNGKVLKERAAGERDEGAKRGPFRVIYLNKKHQQWPDRVKIVLYSRPLIEIVLQYLPNSAHLKVLEEPEIRGRELCIALDALKNHCSYGGGNLEHHGMLDGNGLANGGTIGPRELSNGEGAQDDCGAGKEAAEGKLQLKHLVRFLEEEYRNVPVQVQRMQKESQVTWDMLWAFLPSGKKVVYRCDHSEEGLYAIVSTNYFKFRNNTWVFILELDIWEFDGQSYSKYQIARTIPKYEGERRFAKLEVSPVERIGTPDVLEERFLKNGKNYRDLTIIRKHRFMHYTGPLFQQRDGGLRGDWKLHKENADGRVMIDLESFARMNPNYPMRNARPPSAFWSGTSHSAPRESYEPSIVASEDENLKFAPAIVYGFSFTLKMWGSFKVDGFRDISFDSSAFDELVMEPQLKCLVYDLVSYYTAPAAGSEPLQRVDPISNKGNGCVILCYGGPGTGKTLTAESIAEDLSRPLWALSVAELGTTPKELEQYLFKVLDIAAAWRAVLLLDEADVYLETRRSDADVTRNAMTGVFLRLLEYYRGVLFLTTNRSDTFDEAFLSRISLFMYYPPLGTQQKEKIWRALLEKARILDVSSEKLSELAALNFNGRQIRNAIHMVQSWAHSKGKPLELPQVQHIMGVLDTCPKPQLSRAVQ